MTGPHDAALDVVVVSGPDVAPLRRCLASVSTHLGAVPIRVWVNKGAGRTDADALVAEYPDVDWTLAPDDLGYAAAANLLIGRGDGDLLLLHPDLELLGPLTACRTALRGDRVAVVSPTLADPTGATQPWDVARRRLTLARAVVDRAGRSEQLRGTRWADRYASPPSEVDGYLAAGSLLIARAAWDDVGPFDDRRYFLFGEDRAWQRRAVDRGWRLSLVEEPQVRRASGTALAGDQPTHRVRDLELATAAFALGIRGNSGPGTLLTAADLLLGRVQRSRREARRRGRAVAGTRHGVIITSPKFAIGGAERQRALLANELARRGHPVTVVCLRDLGHLQRMLDPRVRLVLRPWWQPFVDVPGDTVVLVTGTTPIEVAFGSAFSAVTGAGTRRRWLVAAHNLHTYPATLARGISRSHGVIALSEVHWGELTANQHLHTRHWCVPNGVELQEDRGYHPAHPLRVGFLGRIVERKNPHLLVAALAELADLDWRLDLFGSGADEDRLAALVPDAVRDRVRYRGRTAGPAPALAEMDVLCLPSGYEAFPLVLLEAMASGIPAMATAVCAVPEMLDHGRAGVVVPEATVEAWVCALRPVLTDPESLSKVARAGWERVESHYTVSAMTDGYQRVMEEALAH